MLLLPLGEKNKNKSGALCRISWITWSHVIWTTTTSCWTPTSRKTPRCTAVWVHQSESSLLSLWLKLQLFPPVPAEGDAISHMAQWRRRQLCWGTQEVHDNRWGWYDSCLSEMPTRILQFTKSPLCFSQWPPGLQTGQHGEKDDDGCVQGRQPHLGPVPTQVILNTEPLNWSQHHLRGLSQVDIDTRYRSDFSEKKPTIFDHIEHHVKSLIYKRCDKKQSILL